LVARVSEGPEVRRDLKKQIEALLPKSSQVTMLCSYKPGVSWLMDDIAPQIKGKAASLKIEFKKNEDSTGTRSMYSKARWIQELYPVDEMLAKELAILLTELISISSRAKARRIASMRSTVRGRRFSPANSP